MIAAASPALHLAPLEPLTDPPGCVPIVLPLLPLLEPPEPVVTPRPEPEPEPAADPEGCPRCGTSLWAADGRCVECRNAASRDSRAKRRHRAPALPSVPKEEARTWVWDMATLDPRRIGAVAAVDECAAVRVAEAQRLVAAAYRRRTVHGDYWRWHGIAKAGMQLLEELEDAHAGR